MTSRCCVTYRVLAVLVALYGVMSACICTDHVSSQVAMPACHHCAPQDVDAAGDRLASHHQCCGMERAPVAVEKVASVSETISDHYIVLPMAALFAESDAAIVAVSSLSHSPPGDLPLYFTTQRFVI